MDSAKKIAAEFLGTLWLVLGGCGSAVLAAGVPDVGIGYLGVALQPVKIEPDGIGAMVMGVDRDGPAAVAGLHQGDVILAWNGEPLRSVQMLLRALGPASVGTVVKLSLQRAGGPVEAEITIGERPAD